jgi:hypothetical protein
MILPLALILCFIVGCTKAEKVAEEPAVDIAAESEGGGEVRHARRDIKANRESQSLILLIPSTANIPKLNPP